MSMPKESGCEVPAIMVGSHHKGRQLQHSMNEMHSNRGTWKMSDPG